MLILCKTNEPQGRASFDLRAIIWTILVEVHYMKLHTKYQRPRPSSFWEEGHVPNANSMLNK